MNESFSLFDGCRWCSRYSCTASSVILPVDHAPYPVAQKCLPQYRFSRCGNSCWRSREERPFKRLSKSDRAIFGGYSMCIWNVVFRDHAFSDSHIFGITNLNQLVSTSEFDVTLKDVVTIFCYPNNMRGQTASRVRACSVLFHLSLSSNRF